MRLKKLNIKRLEGRDIEIIKAATLITIITFSTVIFLLFFVGK